MEKAVTPQEVNDGARLRKITPEFVAAETLRDAARHLLAQANTLNPTDVDTESSGSPGAALIGQERIRQIAAEGHTAQADSGYDGNELAWAAYCYLERAAQDRLPQPDPSTPHVWPLDRGRWRPKPSRIRNLTIAAALIAAEIDRRWNEGERP